MKRILLGLLLLGALVVVASSALHPGRAQRLERLSESKSRLDALMRETDRTNELLTVELEGLESGPQGWQALARKEYGMLLEGEVVFRFPPDIATARAPASVEQADQVEQAGRPDQTVPAP